MPRVGDTLPAFVRRTGLEEWNRFAAVNDEFVPIHMDDEAGRAAGNASGAFGMGNLRLAYLTAMLRDWAGDEGALVALSAKFRGTNSKGDELRCVGTVTEVVAESGRTRVEIDVDVLDQTGTSTTPGHATVALFCVHTDEGEG